jgi:hypothetical protein
MSRAPTSWLRAALLFVLVFITVPSALAAITLVEPGETPKAAADHGLLVIAVDTNMSINSVLIRREGSSIGGELVRDLHKGRSLRLYSLPAGRYAWRQLRPLARYIFDLSGEDEFTFTVEAGTITYPGDLIFRARTVDDVTFHMSNRGLGVIDWLQAEHSTLFARHRFHYSGHYPDPFPEHYRSLLATRGGKKPDDTQLRLPPGPGPLPLPVKELWRDARVVNARMNPRGDMVAVHVHPEEGRWLIELIDLAAGTATTLATSNVAFGNVDRPHQHRRGRAADGDPHADPAQGCGG